MRAASEPLVRVEGVRKKFCRSLRRALWYGLNDMASEVAGRSRMQTELRRGEFWALNDVSFELRRGECIGLIGRNGAGKTTLLKLINGLIKPDAGRITIRGRVGALISLGAGFNPILTGRENIYVNASILGLTKRETDRQIDEIIDFAEIDEFIDTPVQNYSSGMQVRLGFAVATALRPDVVLLDEVLAVGDAAFRSKCYNRIGALRDQTAMILVSHEMEHIAHVATTGLFLAAGQEVASSTPLETAIDAYRRANEATEGDRNAFLSVDGDFVTSARVSVPQSDLRHGDRLTVRLELTAARAARNCMVRIPLYDARGTIAAEWIGIREGLRMDIPEGESQWEFSVGPLLLATGTYNVTVVLNDATGSRLCVWSFKQNDITVDGGFGGSSPYQLTGEIHSCVASA
jgi:lipopolysaccharide transport system ATP-binding protein